MKIYYKFRVTFHNLMKKYHTEVHHIHGKVFGYSYIYHDILAKKFETKLQK